MEAGTEVLTSPPPKGFRCAAWARDEQLQLIGTGYSFASYVLVEWPRPWPDEVGDHPAFAPLSAVAGDDVRLHALAPERADDPSRRVIVFHRPVDPDGWFQGYDRIERVVDASDAIATAVELLTVPGRDRLPRPDATSDVLVCTHGSCDVSCGSRGTALATELAVEPAATGPVRLWRSSHIGGHHLAPSAMIFPEATVWGFLETDALRRVIAREGPVGDVLVNYRGSAGMATPELQVLERVAFADVGWPWLDYRRRGRVLDDGVVCVEAIAPGGAELHWEATVRATDRVAIRQCAVPNGMTGLFADRRELTDLRTRHGGPGV